MKIEVTLPYFLIWLTVFGSSWQDGFNFYKALNRTPMNRVERFYKDGAYSRYKVPLSKRLFYDGFNEQKKFATRETNNDFVAILFNWGSGIQFNSPNTEKKEECAEMQNLTPDVVLA